MMLRQLKNWSLVLSVILALLVAPIVAAACFCASHYHAGARKGHSDHQTSDNHHHDVSPESAYDDHQHREHKQASSAASAQNRAFEIGQTGCSCFVKNASQQLALREKKEANQQSFHPALPPRVVFSTVWKLQSTAFYAPDVAYRARSDISFKPSRAPPVL
jgi:hypothetical protein